MLTLLTFGTLWFWLVSVIAFLVIVALVENEKEVCAGFMILGTIAAFYFCGNHGILSWIIGNPLTLLWWVLGYFGVACVWAVFKWTFFVHGESDKYEEAKAAFLRSADSDTMTVELKREWTDYANKGYYSGHSFTFPAPEAGDFKSKIANWMVYWPWSAFWTLLNDPVRKIACFLRDRLTGILNKISKHAYRNSSDDIIGGRKGGRKE